MSYTYGNPMTVDSAMDMVTSVFDVMKKNTIEVKFPEILWSSCINLSNIDNQIPMGAETVSRDIASWSGMGAFISAVGANIPTISLSQGKVTMPIESAAIKAEIHDNDIEKMRYGFGRNIQVELPKKMRLGTERHIEREFFFGYPQLGFFGFCSFPSVPVVAATGRVSAQTGEQNVKMFSELYISVLNQTKQVYYPDTLALPFSAYNFLCSQVFNSANGSNIFTLDMIQSALNKLARKSVEIVPIRHLEGAGAGNVDRAKLFLKNSDDNQYFAMPLPFNMLMPQYNGLAIDLFAKYRFGTYYELNPLSGAYLDGI